MKHVFDTLDGWVPTDDCRGRAMRWMPPEQAAIERQKHDDAALATAIELGEVAPEPAR